MAEALGAWGAGGAGFTAAPPQPQASMSSAVKWTQQPEKARCTEL